MTAIPATLALAVQEDQTDYSFHLQTIPGDPLYERLFIDDPKMLAQIMEEEALIAKYMNPLEAQAEMRESVKRSKERLRIDYENHGKWWQRAQQSKRDNERYEQADRYSKRDAYATMGLRYNSKPSLQIIKGAFRRLARELHPDRGGDEAAMKALNSAYKTLMAAGRCC